MKKVIGTNVYNLKQETIQLENHKENLQKAVSIAHENGITDLTTEDIMPLCSDPEKFVIDRLTAEVPTTFAGLPVKKENLFAIAEKPAFVDMLVNFLKEDYRGNRITGYAEYLVIKDGKVSLTTDALDILKEKHTSYAEGQKQIEALEKWKAVEDAFNNLNEKINDQVFHGDRFSVIQDSIEFDTFENKFKIIPNRIQNLR